MKILVVGDPHGNIKSLKKIPSNGIELVLITGDLGKADLIRERHFENLKRKEQGLPILDYDKKFQKAVHMEIHNSTLGVLRYLSKIAPVYTIQGNVGIPNKKEVRDLKNESDLNLPCTKNEIDKLPRVNMVKNVLRIFEDLKIGFLEIYEDASWVKEFKPKKYRERMKNAKKETNKAKRILKRFGKLDVLICHQPPYGYLDKVSGKYGAPKTWHGKHAGGKAILEYIKRNNPRYVFCGHIHEGKGKAKIGKTEVYNLGVAGYKIIDI